MKTKAQVDYAIKVAMDTAETLVKLYLLGVLSKTEYWKKRKDLIQTMREELEYAPVTDWNEHVQPKLPKTTNEIVTQARSILGFSSAKEPKTIYEKVDEWKAERQKIIDN